MRLMTNLTMLPSVDVFWGVSFDLDQSKLLPCLHTELCLRPHFIFWWSFLSDLQILLAFDLHHRLLSSSRIWSASVIKWWRMIWSLITEMTQSNAHSWVYVRFYQLTSDPSRVTLFTKTFLIILVIGQNDNQMIFSCGSPLHFDNSLRFWSYSPLLLFFIWWLNWHIIHWHSW